jgi:hypothetical protein
MARYERAGRPVAGGTPTPDGAPAKVRMRMSADGKFHPVVDPAERVAETAEKPAPPTADDPRSAAMRNLGPNVGPV